MEMKNKSKCSVLPMAHRCIWFDDLPEGLVVEACGSDQCGSF